MLPKKEKNLLSIGILVIILLTYLSTFFKQSFSQEKLIKIGALAPISGPLAGVGVLWMYGIKNAQEEINSRGGWKGIPLEILYIDIGYKPEAAYLGAQKLIYDQSVNFILGTLTIGDALSVSKLAETTKTILITPVTSSQIFSPGLRYTFKVGPTDVDICKASAIYVSEVSKYKKIAFITSNINYLMITTNLQKQFFTKQGLKVVFEETVQWDQKNFYEILTKIKNSKADILYTNLDSIRLGLVLKQIRELGLDIQTIDSAILSSYKDVFNIAGSKIEGHLSIGYPDYKKLGYNSTHLIYDALKKAGTYKRVEEIRKVMITGTRELGGFYDWGGPRRVSVEIVKFTADGDKELIKDIVFDVPPDPPWGKN